MANNVYIGSRYVPLFDGDWVNNKTYEALTIVTYGNNSYTSKIPVPLNTPPTGQPNDQYWALTGNYNGQIANIQNQVNDLYNVKAYEMGSRKFLFLADSYDVVGDFVDTVGANIKCSSFVKRSQSGACFIRHDSPWSQYTYYNILTNLNPLTTAEINEITDVVIFASVNDDPSTDSELKNSMTQMDTYLRSLIPTLKKIHLISIGWASTNASIQTKVSNNLRRYSRYSAQLGWSYVDCTRVMRMCAWFNPSDGYHPTTTGGEQIADAVTNAILTGSCNWEGKVNDYYYTIGAPSSWGTPNIIRPASGEIRLVAKCDANGHISWFNYDNDILINGIALPSYNTYTMSLTPTTAYKNFFPEYYKTDLIPIRNAGEGLWDIARLEQLSGKTQIFFVAGDVNGSATAGLRILSTCVPLIDPN